MPEQPICAARGLARSCDLLLVLGTSLCVQPGASISLIAQEHGSTLAIINKDPEPLDAGADIVLSGSTERILPRVIEHL
jgi:NAD-dependent deacetylase